MYLYMGVLSFEASLVVEIDDVLKVWLCYIFCLAVVRLFILIAVLPSVFVLVDI